jgi:hypothetical protein
MRQCFQLLVYLVFAGVVGTTLALNDWRSPEDNSSSWPEIAVRDTEFGKELDRRRADSLARIGARRLVIHELMQGRLGLPEAASRLRAISEANANFKFDAFRQTFPGASDDIRYCQYAISCIRNELQDDPERAARVVKKLQKEFEDYQK